MRTPDGLCRDRDGAIGKLADSPYGDLVRTYYELEYNALRQGSDYKQELFVCPVVR